MSGWVMLRTPDGALYTTEQFAALTGVKVQSVRGGCWRADTYKGCEVVRLGRHRKPQRQEKVKLGTDQLTMKELYDQYLWCRDSPDMIQIMKDFSGTSSDVLLPILQTFEKWRKENSK